MRVPILALVTILCLPWTANSQNGRSLDSLAALPQKFLSKITRKAQSIESGLDRRTEKMLSRLERQEARLKKKLSKKDSLSAEQSFGDVKKRYDELRGKLKSGADLTSKANLNNYVPYLDTLKTSLRFLDEKGAGLMKLGGTQVKELQSALDRVKGLDNKFSQANAIRDYLRQRRSELKEQLSRFGMLKELKSINKEVYYYSEQLREYKEVLKDPRKIERKTLDLLSKTAVFKKFMQQYSELAMLFPDNSVYGTPQGLAGLQTRSGVQSILQQRIQMGGPDAQQVVQQNIANAQAQISSLKQKIQDLGGGGSEVEIPDFKPNHQKTKSFWQRLELGTDLQNTRGSQFLPITSDLAFSVGYKMNDKNVIGVGASYKMGWGQDIRRVTITHEGVGLRSYVDIKLKGSFFISGGYEQNYRSRFENLQQLRETPSNWLSSGLVGLKKKYSLGKKYKGNVQVLFDFLYRSHAPQTQPVLFRFGYSF